MIYMRFHQKPARLSHVAGIALLLASSAYAAPEDPGAPEKKKDIPLLQQQVPIPSYSPPVLDNGCPVRTDPSQKLAGPYTIPFFSLISNAVGRYAVRLTIADGDPRAQFNDVIKDLDPDTRTLATLYALWDSLGRDGLHTYFYLRGGDVANEVRDALKSAGLESEHELFASAMALFGAQYPDDEKKRAAHFGYARGQGELDAFDLKLMAIAAKFPSRDGFASQIESYVAARPELWRRIEASRKKVGANRRVDLLMEQLWKRLPSDASSSAIHDQLAKLPEAERNLMVINNFNEEFENGGIHQFFFNSSGDTAPDVYQAMVALGLERQARLMQQAMALFSAPYPTDRTLRASSYIGKRDLEGFETELADITDDFYTIEGGPQVTHLGGSTQINGGPGIRDALVRYAQAHKLMPC